MSNHAAFILQDEEGQPLVCSSFFILMEKGDKDMLVLGRKPGEYVIIDGNIIVKVVKSDEGHLRLAIDAPKHVSILRGELADEKKAAVN